MLNGVRGCTCFVLLLTRSTLTRPYVHLELRAAMTVRKPIVVVHDPDDRNGGADLEAIIDRRVCGGSRLHYVLLLFSSERFAGRAAR